jgi:hypothetical protein
MLSGKDPPATVIGSIPIKVTDVVMGTEKTPKFMKPLVETVSPGGHASFPMIMGTSVVIMFGWLLREAKAKVCPSTCASSVHSSGDTHVRTLALPL